ncbi:hypothetical protein CAL7102_02835 [Dulcicalothrix desertica PCC 7102]|nr:hypothetical protein CAL7102_02835 [Dulcicalothrix desertica PCC 7102]
MKIEFRLTLKDVQEAIKIRNKKILMICDGEHPLLEET